MNTAKPSARPMVLRVVLSNLLVCLLVDGGVYYVLQSATQRIGVLAAIQPPMAEVGALNDWILTMGRIFWPYFVPASVLLFILIALLTALSLRRSFASVKAPKAGKAAKAPSPKPDQVKAEVERQALEINQRLYLHLVTVLQKEGRLLDFFSEDLSQYNDGQIGSAVRNIHESCKKALRNHVDPQAVLEQNEGEEITVDKDFDPNVIKLVGNVTGQPPFEGVVQHRGWRARKLALPTFSGQQTPDIIAPAEVEVR